MGLITLNSDFKQFLSTPKRHPKAFAAIYIPSVIGVIVSSVIYRFTFAYCLPLLWSLFVTLILIQGVEQGRFTDNHGTAIRSQTPVRFWAKISVWSLLNLFAIAWCVGFALQERQRERTAPVSAANQSQLTPAEANRTSGAIHSHTTQ